MTQTKTINSTSISVTPVGAALGAEISGVDLSKELSPEEFGEIENAFNEMSVIFFRNQNILPDQHIAFTKRFGGLEISPHTQYALSNHPEILLVSNVEENGKLVGLADAGRFWHTDMSYTEKPPRCSIMHAIEIPMKDGESLGETHFVSTAAAYDSLDEEMKKKIDGLQAIHSYRNKKRVPDSKRDEIARQHQRERPDIVHPVVRTHPATGRKCIYVADDDESIGIVGMPNDEALSLIQQLSKHCIQDRFKYRHRWQIGDVLMWDNCAVQHRAIADYELPLRRLMHRTTVDGTIPV